MPLALPPMAATGLFAFMLSYAEFMFSMVLSGEATSRPASVVMAALARNPDVSWSLLNTGDLHRDPADRRARRAGLALRARRSRQRRGEGLRRAMAAANTTIR